MATTTPNFGWAVPTSSDLVKNGATAIETLGDAIDASMVDLKGGTTGQVLSKASNTDMDFTWSTASGGSNLFYAGKNKIINGDFSVNQRNFTSNTTSATFNFDRWQQSNVGGTYTITPQTFTTGSAPVAGYEGKTFIQAVTASQSAAGDLAYVGQNIESVRTFAGQTVTLSFWAKANTGTPKIAVSLGQIFGTGGSPSSAVTNYVGQATLSTSWARYSMTYAVPSISGKTIGTNNNDYLQLALWTSAGSSFNALTGSLGIQNFTAQIWGVQLEAGSSATDFVTASGNNLQGELALCQRYYYRLNSSGSGFKLIAAGQFYSSTKAYAPIPFPVQMRTSPTALDTTATASDYGLLGAAGGTNTMTSLPTVQSYTTNTANIEGTIASGGVGGNGTVLFFNGSAGYLGFSAEL